METKFEDNGELKELFFLHSVSVKLLAAYHYVIQVDCTYKKINTRFLCFISQELPAFSLDFCFIAEKTQLYYTSTLKLLFTIFNTNKISLLNVLITNQEQELMNPLYVELPEEIHLFCTWHIQKNLVSNAAKLIKDKSKKKKCCSKGTI